MFQIVVPYQPTFFTGKMEQQGPFPCRNTRSGRSSPVPTNHDLYRPSASSASMADHWMGSGWRATLLHIFYRWQIALHRCTGPQDKQESRVRHRLVPRRLVLEGQQNFYSISLLNPLTGTHLSLPEAPEQLFTRRIQYNMHFDPLHPESTLNYIEIQYLIHQMAISSDPLSTTSCIFVVISAGNKALVLLRKGVDGYSWRMMNNQSKYEDVVFFRKRFVAVNCLGEVSFFSGINLNKLSTIASPSTDQLNKADWKLVSISPIYR